MPSALIQGWKEKLNPAIGFLLLWMLLPLAFFSLSRGKLPTYIMPCLLPLALLMGHVLIERITQAKGHVLRINGVLNLVLGVGALIALIYLQITRPVYGHDEMLNLSLTFIVLMGWIIANVLPAFRPLTFWVTPALGIWLLVALLPPGMPNSIVYSQMPDQFVNKHLAELQPTTALLSNDLSAASALTWRLRRTDVVLYNTSGELKYGLDYADASQRQVDMNNVQQWMTEARKHGPVGVVMRVKNVVEEQEVELLPVDGKRYQKGEIVILVFPQRQP